VGGGGEGEGEGTEGATEVVEYCSISDAREPNLRFNSLIGFKPEAGRSRFAESDDDLLIVIVTATKLE
jgi:hypothetical protein